MNSKVNSNIWTAYRLFYIFYIVKLNYIYFVLIYIFSFVFNVLRKFVSLCTLFASLAEKKEDGGVGNWCQGWIIFEKNRQKKKIFPELFIPFLDLNKD